MATLTIRPYQGTKDRFAITDLIQAYAAAIRINSEEFLSDLRLKLNAPHLNPNQDIRLWEDENKNLIGLGLIEKLQSTEGIDGYLDVYVHPSEQGNGLEQQILEWGKKRLQQVSIHHNCPVQLRLYSLSDQTEYNVTLRQQGFSLVRQFITMERSLLQPIPTLQLPPQFKLTYLSHSSDIPAWVNLYNESFIDHWNHHPVTPEIVQNWHRQPNYRPELDLIAVSPKGTFAAFCHAQFKSSSQIPNESAWIEWLGTRRGFRKMGLGRAMLLAGLHQLQTFGVTTAKLSVDTQNSGAYHLYQSVGFQPAQTWLSWVKPL